MTISVVAGNIRGVSTGVILSEGGVAEPRVARPSITSPVDDAVDIGETPTLTSSAFAVTNEGSDTHASSDWQIASDAGFSSVVVESLDDATNKTSWTVPSSLDADTEHFARVRHTGTALGDSSWSPTVSFTTAEEASDPIVEMFASGEDGFYVPIHPDYLYTNTARTTNATVGDAVAGFRDISGNGNHGAQAVVAARPILREKPDGTFYLEIDIDDAVDWSLQLNGSRWTGGYGYETDGRDFIAFNKPGGGSPFVAIGQSGSSNTGLAASAAINSIYFGNVQATPTTRGQMHTAAQGGSTVIADFTPGSDWPVLRIGAYASTLRTPGNVFGGLFMINRQLTAPERTALHEGLATA